MMQRSRTRRSIRCGLAALVAVVGCGFANAAAADALCRITEIGVFNNRVHVVCDPAVRTDAYKQFKYFAIPTTDAAFATRVLDLLLSARQNGKLVIINFNNTSGAGQSFGCQSQDCLAINFVLEP